MERSVAPLRALGARLAGRYRLDRLIARDDVGDVYEALDERLERRVALKVFRLDREVTMLAALDHSGVERVLDAGEDDGAAFVVLELADAPTLVARTGALDAVVVGDPEEAAAMGHDSTQVIAGLDEAADHTAVLPVALAPSPVPSAGAQAVGSVVATMWARRVLVGAVAAVALLVLVAAAFSGGGVEVPPPSTQPVTVESTTTVAPTTTTTTAPDDRDNGRGEGKKKGQDEEDD